MATDRIRVGIIGASGYTGAELLRLCAQHPNVEVVSPPATPRPAPGRRAVPEPGRGLPRPRVRAFDADRCDGLDVVFLGLPHEASHGAWRPQLVGKVGVVVDLVGRLPAEGRRRCTRSGTASSTTSPSCWPSACTACPSCTARRSKGARLVATPGCYVTAASLALAPLVRPALDRADRHHRRRRVAACRAPAGR